MSEQSRGYLEVRDGRGGVARVPLTSGRMVIGRGSDAAVRLDSGTVSRHHAEVYGDPFGRWWVRDLKSRNGTLLRGQPILEHMLQPGDAIQIEDFVITLRLPSTSTGRTRDPNASGVTLTETNSAVRRLRDLESPRIAASHLSALTRLGTALLNTADPHERRCALCRLMVSQEFNGTTAAVLRLHRDQGEEAAPEVICGPESSTRWRGGELPHVSRTILRAVLKNQTPVVASNVGSTGVVEMSIATDAPEMSAIACPLTIDEAILDLLYVTFPVQYGNPEWLALAALAAEQLQQADAVWDARRHSEAQAVIEQELKHAQDIQMRLVPRSLEVPGVEVAIGFEPCQWVGGDYVDAVPLDDGRVLFILADVSGHGLPAALISARLHSMINTNVHGAASLAQLLGRLNAYLCSTLPDDSFVTAAGVILDPATGEMECVNAGHPPPMVVEPGGKLRQLQSAQNPPLGFMELSFEAQRERLGTGQTLALYSDGLSEMMDASGHMLGIEQLGEYLRRAAEPDGEDASAARVAARFKQRLDAFHGDLLAQDDCTYLLVRRT